MDDDDIAHVRQFNRCVTQRVGALNDQYLARDRPLGSSRVLWEITERGTDVRWLRIHLGLDSGHLSRLLRGLESEGLITVGSSDEDKRMRTARLTKRGRAERAVLDRRSDALARSLLEPLSERQQQRLVTAMQEVERLLTATLVEIDVVDPAGPTARHCLGEYFAELDQRFETGFDASESTPEELDEMRSPRGTFLVATLRDEPIGCGGLKFHRREPTEIKRMWIAPSARGLGVGRRLLDELETRAAAAGSRAVHLETNRSLTEAINMYRSAGYREVDAFNTLPYAHHWFEKRLPRRR